MLNIVFILKRSSTWFNYQTVRWIRNKKPFWLGRAKSKEFVVPKKKELPDNELSEVTRLKDEYNLAINSLRNFIINKNQIIIDIDKNQFGEPTQEIDKEILESLKRNNHWNIESGKLREARLKKLAEELEAKAVSEVIFKEEAKKKLQVKVDEMIRQQKEMSQFFVTPDNLNEAVDQCLKNVVDYNFAIDLTGKKFFGREIYQKTLSNSSGLSEDNILESRNLKETNDNDFST